MTYGNVMLSIVVVMPSWMSVPADVVIVPVNKIATSVPMLMTVASPVTSYAGVTIGADKSRPSGSAPGAWLRLRARAGIRVRARVPIGTQFRSVTRCLERDHGPTFANIQS